MTTTVLRFSRRNEFLLMRMKIKNSIEHTVYKLIPACYGCGKETTLDEVTKDKQNFICKECNEKEINKTMTRHSLNGD